jgi:hypothetical protein
MLHTVLLRNNLTENAFGTSPKRVLKCVPFAFHLRSICVPFAFHLRSKCVPFAFHFYWNAPAFRVPVILFLLLLFCVYTSVKNALPSFFWDAFQPRSDRVPAAFRPRSDRVPTAFGTHSERIWNAFGTRTQC